MRVLVLTAMYPTPDNPAFGSFVRTQVESLRRAGVEIEVLVLQGRPRKLIYPKGVFELRRRLAQWPADLIHAHYSLTGMVARTQWKAPIVVTYHGSDVLGGINEKGQRNTGLVVQAGLRLGEMVDAIIVQSEEMAGKFRRKDVHIVPHEVDLDLFHLTDRQEARARLGLDPAKKYLLFAARPDNWVKRFPLALAAAERLQAQDPTVELVVVYRETQDRLALYMNACDALVFPSYQEGSPNIVKQAMACNLPIVATDVGDVRQVIAGTAGCYVCAPEVDEFVDRLSLILSQRERTQGREAIGRFSLERVAGQIIGVYQEVLANRRQARVSSGSAGA